MSESEKLKNIYERQLEYHKGFDNDPTNMTFHERFEVVVNIYEKMAMSLEQKLFPMELEDIFGDKQNDSHFIFAACFSDFLNMAIYLGVSPDFLMQSFILDLTEREKSGIHQKGN